VTSRAPEPRQAANIWKISNTRKAKRIRRRRALPKANNNTAVKRLGATGKLIKWLIHFTAGSPRRLLI